MFTHPLVLSIGNEIPSTYVENILDGSISMQDNPPEHGTMLHGKYPLTLYHISFVNIQKQLAPKLSEQLGN